MVSRYDVYLINLDERLSGDARNTRPAVVVSPDELNRNVASVIIAPLSSTNAAYPTRVPVEFLGATRHVILDQMHTVDTDRLFKKIGEIDAASQAAITARLIELFS